MVDRSGNELDQVLAAICQRLQLSQTLHEQAEQRYQAIGTWLCESTHTWLQRTSIYAQGSFRICTTVRPDGRNEYDLDIVCEFQLDWRSVRSPLILLDLVEGRLREHEKYRAMLERKRRCIRVKYAGQFHLDILPACPEQGRLPGCLLVPDRELRTWKPSNPKGYAEWFALQCWVPMSKSGLGEFRADVEPFPEHEKLEQKETLKRVVQLLKRGRDVSFRKTPELMPISIVLTTLAGNHYRKELSESAALLSILNGIVAQIPQDEQAYGRLVVLNPSNPVEDLSERWNEDRAAYQAFKGWIHAAHRMWTETMRGRGLPVLAKSLGVLFGEEPTRSAVGEVVSTLETSHAKGSMGVQRGSGLLTTVSTPTVLPVRPHTFHGGREWQ